MRRTLMVGPLIVVLAYLAIPGFSASGGPIFNAYNLSAVVSALALIAALVVQRPKPLWPWVTIAASLLLWVLGDAVYTVLGHEPLVSIADAFYVAGYLGLIVATMCFVRKRTRVGDADSLIDVSMVGIAGILAVWELVIEPTWNAPGSSTAGQLMSATYPVLDVVMLVMLVRLLLSPRRPMSAAVLAGGMGAIFLGDTVYAVLAQTDAYRGVVSVLLDSSWLFGYALFPIAALHHSMGAMTVDPGNPANSRLGSLFIPAATLFSIPAVTIAAKLLYGDIGVETLALSGLMIIPLVLWRLIRLTRSTEQARVDVVRQENYYRAVAINSSDAFVVIDADGMVLDASNALEALLGYSSGEVIGADGMALILEEDRELSHALLRDSLDKPGQTVVGEVRMRTASGDRLWVELRCTNLLDEAAVGGVVVNTHDITARKVAERELEYQAFHDPLTGLANRSLFTNRIEHALMKRGSDVAVAFCDLDGFKLVNDSLGHDSGDRLLEFIASRLVNAVRTGDTVARLGGDEFAVLLEGATNLPEEASVVADRMLRALSDPVTVNGTPLVITGSIGLAIASEGGQEKADELLRDADTAMYGAKATGRNRIVRYESSMRATALSAAELAADLRGVVERGELVLMYQPLYDLVDNRLHGFEALVRWQHPTRGLLAPHDFISIAEETGAIVDIGAWVLDRACRCAAEWRTTTVDGDCLTMSVNLSARQLDSPDLIDRVTHALATSGLPPSALVLELTESLLVEQPDKVAAQLRELKALGLRLAIDDFGVGYSSLGYLRQFPFDILKIDQSFIGTSRTHDRMPANVDGRLELGRTLGLETVAEGIETEAQLHSLQVGGCDIGQGFLFAKPLEEVAATALLKAQIVAV